MAYVLGCDPGRTGAIVGVGLYNLVILRTPCGPSAKGKGDEIVYNAMTEDFKRKFTDPGVIVKPSHIFIERVQAMPGNGGSSMFKFGTGFGFLLGIAAMSEIPWDRVEPTAWKRYAHIKPGADKEVSIARACEIWPRQAGEFMPKRGFWTKEECIGVADAAMIGYYGLSLLGAAQEQPSDPNNEFDI